MTRFVIAPYHLRVSAAKELAVALGGFRIRPEQSAYRGNTGDIVVNWGRSNLPPYPSSRVINKASAVKAAIHKDQTFWHFRNRKVPTVDWTEDCEEAYRWTQDGHVVVQRQQLTGRGGDGIVFLDHPITEWDREKGLWTKYFKRKHEYRVHVVNGKAIFLQQKKLRNGTEKHANTYRVRSWDNGWIFSHKDLTVPEAVIKAGIDSVASLGLDFGASDIGWNERDQQAAVFEVNSAPGIEGSTITAYANAIKDLAA